MLNQAITIEELLNAKEGEHYQFKEAKQRLIPVRLPVAAAHWRTAEAEDLSLVFLISGLVRSSGVLHSSSRNERAKGLSTS